MNRVDLLLDQIERLKAQNRLETDPDLRRENKKTIKSLHEEVRNPWRGMLHKVVFLFLVFFIAICCLLGLTHLFGLSSVAMVSTVIAAVMVIMLCTILLVSGHINQDTFKGLVDTCLRILPSGTPNAKVGGPDKGATLSPVASKTIFAESDPVLPAPKKKRSE